MEIADLKRKTKRQGTSKSSKEKNASRSLHIRRAIEDRFDDKRLDSLIGDAYWGSV